MEFDKDYLVTCWYRRSGGNLIGEEDPDSPAVSGRGWMLKGKFQHAIEIGCQDYRIEVVVLK